MPLKARFQRTTKASNTVIQINMQKPISSDLQLTGLLGFCGLDGRSLMTVPFGTDIVCGCSILLFGCKLFGTTLFLVSVNGLGLAAPTLTVRLCLLWSIWLDSTPAGRKNSKFKTRSVVQCPRIFFKFMFHFY